MDGLDLDVPEGICFGLLGPNGAGKTTTMRMLTAQAIADEGTIEVLGFRLPEHSREVRARLGVVPQHDNLDVELSVRQNVTVFTRLYRVPRARRTAAVDLALQRARLVDRADDPVQHLSGGMRRRLLIARALVHEPECVLLDEPTVGLDPQVRHELWSLIDDLRERGVTIFMSTHYIEEAQRLADRVAIVNAGKVIAEGRPSELIARHAGREVIEVFGHPADLARVRERAIEAGHPTRARGPAIAIMRAEYATVALPDGERRAASLEDVYVLLTGEDAA